MDSVVFVLPLLIVVAGYVFSTRTRWRPKSRKAYGIITACLMAVGVVIRYGLGNANPDRPWFAIQILLMNLTMLYFGMLIGQEGDFKEGRTEPA